MCDPKPQLRELVIHGPEVALDEMRCYAGLPALRSPRTPFQAPLIND
jgi:hypothetical protein